MDKEQFKNSLTGRVALITGAARGIGRATAIALAEAGADIILGVRNASSASNLAEHIRSIGRKVTVAVMDVTDLNQCNSVIKNLIDDISVIDILVNNAGGGIVDKAIDIKTDDFDFVINLNVKSALFISQQIAKNLIETQRKGSIINVSSQAGLVALPGETSYCLSKAALSHLTRCLAVEWGQQGIRVNAVCPTFIETPGTQEMLSNPAFRDDTIERIAALKRLGKPEEVASAIVFLASPAASLITGHNLVIDGGWTVR